jgi:hypothetical protein
MQRRLLCHLGAPLLRTCVRQVHACKESFVLISYRSLSLSVCGRLDAAVSGDMRREWWQRPGHIAELDVQPGLHCGSCACILRMYVEKM